MPIREYIERTFPEIREIRDPDLRTKVVDVIETAMERGGWETLDEIPFTLLIETDVNMVQHVREVTRIAMAVGRGRDDINMDHTTRDLVIVLEAIVPFLAGHVGILC